MRLLTGTTTFAFMRYRNTALIFSAAVLVVSIAALATRGLDFGIDFTGGTLIEVSYEQPAEIKAVREQLGRAGFPEAVAQHFGTTHDVLVRIAPREDRSKAQLSEDVLAALRAGSPQGVQMRRVEFVGPQIGDELAEAGGLALLIALGAIFVYIMLRFEWKFSAGAVAALFHDVIITIGCFSVFGLEFDLTVLAALLAVIGYSLNDTIVVFDRIRENFRKMRKGTSSEIIDTSLNQTLSRTLMTSLTTLLVLAALFLVGGELIHGFATALIIGIVVGTYSSIFVASTMALMLGVNKQDLMPVAKEGAEAESGP